MNAESGEPFCTASHKEHFLQKRRAYERHRYWDPRKGVRKRRLARSAKERRRPPKAVQSKLDEFSHPRGQGVEKDMGTNIN